MSTSTGEEMKFLLTFCIAMLLFIYSITSYADEDDLAQTEYKNPLSNLVTNSSPVSQLILIQDLSVVIDNVQALEKTPKIKGEFNTRLFSIEAGMLQSKQESNWNKYYFQGAVILHQQNEFNVSFMANIEQINNFNHYNEQTSFTDNTIILSETELNYSYGLITSYAISPAWQFSGGIIHAESLNNPAQNTWLGDANMALIGTTYSF